MVEINTFTDFFMKNLNKEFGSRIWFAGLQGSYARGEADENSDIDIVVILDELTASDIEKYNRLLDSFSERNLLCGFLSGKEELLNWNAAELFQFYYDTKPLFGSLACLLERIDAVAVENAVKSAACSIYHACVHNMLYEKSADILKDLYKSAIFILQAFCFKQTGRYVSKKAELVKVLSGADKQILNTFLLLKKGGKIDFKEMSERLFCWSKNLIDEGSMNK
ncbi:MAG: nucleotidyltransferase domain-containing protein [Eubacterium sp.]|mgnify:CR=1 FL=1